MAEMSDTERTIWSLRAAAEQAENRALAIHASYGKVLARADRAEATIARIEVLIESLTRPDSPPSPLPDQFSHTWEQHCRTVRAVAESFRAALITP